MDQATNLPQLLARLEVHLIELGAPVVSHLRPGADRQHVEAVLGERGVVASEELLAWWGWHDGTDVADRFGGAFVPLADNLLLANWHLPSVADAARGYDLLQHVWDGELPTGWWPVLEMSVPADLCADTASSGALFLVDAHSELPDDPPEPLATSLTDFVELLLDLFEAGAVLPRGPYGGGPWVDHARLPRALPFPAYW